MRTTILSAALLLCGCATAAPPAPVDQIRQEIPNLSHNSDEELIELMHLACDVMEQDGIFGMAQLSMQYDIDPEELGRFSAIAAKEYCPGGVPN